MAGTISAIAARITDSWAPIPRPQSAAPTIAFCLDDDDCQGRDLKGQAIVTPIVNIDDLARV